MHLLLLLLPTFSSIIPPISRHQHHLCPHQPRIPIIPSNLQITPSRRPSHPPDPPGMRQLPGALSPPTRKRARGTRPARRDRTQLAGQRRRRARSGEYFETENCHVRALGKRQLREAAPGRRGRRVVSARERLRAFPGEGECRGENARAAGIRAAPFCDAPPRRKGNRAGDWAPSLPARFSGPAAALEGGGARTRRFLPGLSGPRAWLRGPLRKSYVTARFN